MHQRPMNCFPTIQLVISLLAVGVFLLIPIGCQTLTEGFNDIAEGLSPTTPREAAEFALDPEDPDKRREGILLLSNSHFGHETTYVQMYREYVRFETDPMVKAVSIQALARYGEPADAIFILPHLSDENEQVRREAAKGLQRLHNPEAVSELVRVAGDSNENPDVRAAAAIALGQYPQGNVFQVLVAALNAKELSVNMASRHSLHTLTGMDFDLDSVAWLHWQQETEPQGSIFTNQQEYFYPTYSRDLSWLEELAFWNKPSFEPAGQPAGITPKGQRSTYQDENPDQDTPGG